MNLEELKQNVTREMNSNGSNLSQQEVLAMNIPENKVKAFGELAVRATHSEQTRNYALKGTNIEEFVKKIVKFSPNPCPCA